MAATQFGYTESNCSQMFKRNALARLILQHQMCLVYKHVLCPVRLSPTRRLPSQQNAQTIMCTSIPASHTPSCSLSEGDGQTGGSHSRVRCPVPSAVPLPTEQRRSVRSAHVSAHLEAGNRAVCSDITVEQAGRFPKAGGNSPSQGGPRGQS